MEICYCTVLQTLDFSAQILAEAVGQAAQWVEGTSLAVSDV